MLLYNTWTLNIQLRNGNFHSQKFLQMNKLHDVEYAQTPESGDSFGNGNSEND